MAWNFENKTFEGIHYSRFIASWRNAAGKDRCSGEFEMWLEHLEINGKHLPETVVREISDMAITGKLELENDIRNFKVNLDE